MATGKHLDESENFVIRTHAHYSMDQEKIPHLERREDDIFTKYSVRLTKINKGEKIGKILL